ncbi:hypothetical protein ID866_11776 [Astraeus odoratus]|nr:hypothetical protein ID866_11776 [Astraeus odoratus]
MSTHKSSKTMGTPATKITDWTKVPDKELVTDIDDTDLVGDVKVQEKCRRLCAACDKEIWRAEKVRREAEEQEQKHQVEEVEKHWKEEVRCQKEAEAEQDQEAEKARQAAAAEARKWQRADSEAQASRSWVNMSAVSTHMDVANGHLERIASMAQSNGWKMQCHYLLMEGLVGQQQLLLSKLVEITGAMESGGAKGTTEGAEELKELQGEGSGGQEETEGVPGGVLEGELEDALGNELEDDTGVEDGAGEEGQQSKGKEKAL